jgi:hypothetical protein
MEERIDKRPNVGLVRRSSRDSETLGSFVATIGEHGEPTGKAGARKDVVIEDS